jgi:hypothetical protein
MRRGGGAADGVVAFRRHRLSPCLLSSAHSTRIAKQRGQAIVEYIILFPVMVLLILGTVQFALIYQAKSTLDYATFMAARQGALKNAKKLYIKDGLAEGMTPLFANSSDLVGMLRGRAVAMIEAFNPLATEVDILNPTKEVFDSFAVDGKMPNDNLMYRPTTEEHGENIQDANVLTVKVRYCVPLIVPLVNKVIYSLYFGYKAIVNLSGVTFVECSTATNDDNFCEDLRDQLHDKVVDGIDAANGVLGAFGASIPTDLASTLTSIGKSFPTTIPILNWNLAGYRIPIYATASVRMQSPAQM